MTGLLDVPGVCAHEIFGYLSTPEIMNFSLCSKAASQLTQLVRLERKKYKDWNFIAVTNHHTLINPMNYHPLELICAIKQTPVIAQHIWGLLINPDWSFPFSGYTKQARGEKKHVGELLGESKGWLGTQFERFADAGILDDCFTQGLESSYEQDRKENKITTDEDDDMRTVVWLVALSMLPQLDDLMFLAESGPIVPFVEKLVRYQHSLEDARHDRSSRINFITPTKLTMNTMRPGCVLSARYLTTLLLLPTLEEVTCRKLNCHKTLSWPTWTKLFKSERDDGRIQIYSNVKTMRFVETYLHAEAIAELLRGMPKLTVLEWDGSGSHTVVSGSQQGIYETLGAQDWERRVREFHLEKSGKTLSSTIKFICLNEAVSADESQV